jgi:hypothetical protein
LKFIKERHIYLLLALITGVQVLPAQDSIDTAAVIFVPRSYDAQAGKYLYAHSDNVARNAFTDQELDSSQKNRIILSGSMESNSNGVANKFVLNFLFKDNFGNSQKDKIFKQLKDQNGYEDNVKAGIYYKHYFPRKDISIIAGVHFRTMRTAFIKKQMYEAVFYGNAKFEDQKIDLGRLSFQNMLYNQFSIGFQKNFRTATGNFSFGAIASFLHGLNNQSLYVQEGSYLYTAPDGEYIDFVHDMRYDQSRFGNKREREKVDVGFSADISFRYQKADKFSIALTLEDFGIIKWRKEPKNFYGKDSVRFNGIYFEDITNIATGQVDLNGVTDSLLPARHDDKYQTFLPFTASLVFSKPLLRNKLVLNAGIQYKPLYRYYAYGFIKANYFIKPTLPVSLSVGYGGYTKFNLGFEVAKHWRNFDIAVGTNNIIGTAAPLNYTGLSAYLKAGFSF